MELPCLIKKTLPGVLISGSLVTLMVFQTGWAEELQWTERLEFSGLVEFEAFKSDGPDEDESDIDLATVELGLDVTVTEEISAYALLLIEAPDHDIELDEAGIEIATQKGVFNLGRFYIPFGSFESHMISDPLTLEVGETNEEAALYGFGSDSVNVSIFIYNGEVDEIGSDNEIDNFGVALGFESDRVSAGFSYVNSIADSDLISEAIGEEGISDYAGGIALYGIAEFNGFTAVGEYVTATDSFSFAETVIEPSAYNLEVGYGFDLNGKEAVIAVGVQGTDEALALELPESKILIGFSYALYESTSLSFEFSRESDYDTREGGSGEDTNVFTIQVAAEF